MERRHFLEFLGKGIIATSLLPPYISVLGRNTSKRTVNLAFRIGGLQGSDADELMLADGLNYDVLLSFGDRISEKDTFGFNNDYLAFIPTHEHSEGILWVNHEYINSMFVSGYTSGEKTKDQIHKEMYNTGGSLIKIRKENEKWIPEINHSLNRRLSGFTEIPFNWDHPIMGKTDAMGTLQNCAGGVTPWGTILTCEENYNYCYGERNLKTGEIEYPAGSYSWDKLYKNPPEHYGWVVEVDPKTGSAQKHVALGRCAHECATTVELADKRVVVYTGDDKTDECIYKFISDQPGSLDSGTLYVANLGEGKWESLKYEDQPVLQEHFNDQTEILIRLREASKLVGGTQLARPEDIEIDPVTGNVIVALTNDIPKKNYYGEIIKITEDNGKFQSLTFNTETFLTGGVETGFACPDNLAFDLAGNLWFTSDISGGMINKPPYEVFKNNGLFLVPRTGPQQGEVTQIASAPVEAEFTGPCFTPDGKTLFLSVQHPGENSKTEEKLTSHWPGGGKEIPKPSVVTISGPLLDRIQGILP